jgi:pimeloyl-ACP methyl ester carboxylesterase
VLKATFPSRTLRILFATVFAVVFLLLFFQNFLIYHPRRYAAGVVTGNPALVPLSYITSQGRQQVYYLAPRLFAERPPSRLWVVFPGNGSLALDWVNFLDPPPDPRDGFLLIDYPGYGDCAGSPSPAAIEASAEAAFACLAQSLHIQPAVLDENVNLLCHSIGCATGLNFAAKHPIQRMILLAPFTSLRDMARRTVGWPLCWVLLHNFDNRARLRELAARTQPPRVTILHGDDDQLVPVSMGRQLAGMFPRMIIFQDIPGADHNTIVMDARAQIFAAMGNE